MRRPYDVPFRDIRTITSNTRCVNFRTAVPFWGQATQMLSSLSPKRDCGSKRVDTAVVGYSQHIRTHKPLMIELLR